jgi:hypothetical protein
MEMELRLIQMVLDTKVSFVYGQIQGQGKVIWANGDIYEGQVNKGKMEGHGTFFYNRD